MSDAGPSSLQPRILGRTGREISPIIWHADQWVAGNDAQSIVAYLTDRRLNAFFIDCTVPVTPQHAKLLPGEGGTLLLGIDLQMLLARPDTELRARLAALPKGKCDALVLQNVNGNELKSGRPFHRLSQLRDEGGADMLIIEASDAAQAEWMVENTAAHAIVLPYDIDNQTSRYRLLSAATELGVGLIARESATHHSASSRRFRLSEPEISAVLAVIPKGVNTLEAHLRDYAETMNADERARLWDEFQQRVPEPARPRGNHPPEYGS